MKKKTTEQFIIEASQIHNNFYDYSETVYVNSNSKVKIICKKHGEFYQRASHHLAGSGCPICNKINNQTRQQISKSEFIEKAVKIHGELYDYSLVDYVNNKTPVKIICKKHGEFYQIPFNHTCYGSGCPKCASSKGEKKIAEFLNSKNIDFIQQARFSDCKDKQQLPFDFYIPNNNLLIEFDGRQHFESVKYWNGKDGLEIRKNHDKIKDEFAKKNNFQLLRIRFDENVDKKLTELFNSL